MITEIHNNSFKYQDSDQRVKEIMSLSESLRKKNSFFINGSDDHLDYISNITKNIEILNANLKSFNDSFESRFPNNKEDGEIIVKVLHLLHSGLSLAIENLKKENPEGTFKSCLNKLEIENNQLIEYIEDINEFIIYQDENNLLDSLT